MLDYGAGSAGHAGQMGSLSSWFPLLFVAMWLGICTLLAWIAGHMLLLARFPPVDERIDQKFWWASGSMRAGVSFRSALYVGIGAMGLHIAPNWLFRPVFFRRIPYCPRTQTRVSRRLSLVEVEHSTTRLAPADGSFDSGARGIPSTPTRDATPCRANVTDAR